jgi:signal transduction histidine kinase
MEEVKRMSDIVKDLLLVSRLDNQEDAPVNTESVQLNDLVTDVVERLKGYAKKHEVKLTISPRNVQDMNIVTANKDHLFRAISNIVKNGIDYNRPGGSVTISTEHNQEQAIITVTDTGIGIANHEIPKLFDRFYRVDKSRSRQVGGNGLGLSIVQSIAHAHDGNIAIDSKAGKGTTVTLTLPRQT